MNAQMKQLIDERLERLSDQRMAEVLDFVEFLEAKEQQASANQATIDETLAHVRQIVKSPSKGRLGPPFLDTTGFKFNRDEANER